MTPDAPTHGPAAEPRVVLVETSEALPGLLTHAGWEALSTADAVVAREPEQHPSAPYVAAAGITLEQLEPRSRSAAGLDLLSPGSPSDRGLALALLDLAEARGSVALLRDDREGGELARAIGLEAASRHVEVEFVFLDVLPPGTELVRLAGVERRLRDPDGGCPWDLEQDHTTLARYLLEETYELLEAIDSGDDDHLREELGDVLLQVVFHAQVAADRGAFDVDDVARGIADKLVRRHPHVFGDVEVADADEVKANWDALKAEEKQHRTSPFDGVPWALPALQLSHDLQRKAARTGFRWPDLAGPVAKVREELDELLAADTPDDREHELGDLLAAVVAVARHLELDPEGALRRQSQRFRDRVERMLRIVAERGGDPEALDAEAWVRLWDEAGARDR